MDWTSINYVAIGVLLVLIFGLVNGVRCGLVKMVISLAVSIVTVILAAAMAPYVFKLLKDKKVTEAAAFVATLIILFIILKIVTYIIEAMAEFPVISIVNRLLGALFGLLSSLMFVWIFFALVEVLHVFSVGEVLYKMIESNYYVKMLYDMNPILKLF